MNKSSENAKKLWLTLALLTVAIVLAIGMDSISFPTFSSDPTEDAVLTESTDTPSSDDTAQPPALSVEIITGDTDTVSEDATLSITFLGESAPGSPYGTTAYGSLNALTAEQGAAYFFSALSSVLTEDDLTVLANSCTFTDTPVTGDSGCSAPTENLSVFSEGYIDVVAHLSPEISDTAQDAVDLYTAAGLTAAVSGTVHVIDRHGIRTAILYEQISKNADAAHLASKIQEIKKTVDYVILYFYGGEADSHTPEEWLRTTLQSCIRAGVSLAIGVGPDVLRPMETFEGGTIVYSLGSLVDGSALVPENATVLLQAELSRGETGEILSEIRIIPCHVYKDVWQPAVMTEEADIQRVHQFLKGEAPLPVNIDIQ